MTKMKTRPRLTRARLLARLAWLQEQYLAGAVLTLHDQMEDAFYSHKGYYDMTITELRAEYAELLEEMDVSDEQWQAIDRNYRSWIKP